MYSYSISNGILIVNKNLNLLRIKEMKQKCLAFSKSEVKKPQ